MYLWLLVRIHTYRVPWSKGHPTLLRPRLVIGTMRCSKLPFSSGPALPSKDGEMLPAERRRLEARADVRPPSEPGAPTPNPRTFCFAPHPAPTPSRALGLVGAFLRPCSPQLVRQQQSLLFWVSSAAAALGDAHSTVNTHTQLEHPVGCCHRNSSSARESRKRLVCKAGVTAGDGIGFNIGPLNPQAMNSSEHTQPAQVDG